MRNPMGSPWWRDSNETASGKPGAVQMTVKDAGMRIRVERSLRERFITVCRLEDKPAAQVIREFMRSYVESRKQVVRRENNKEPMRGARKREGVRE